MHEWNVESVRHSHHNRTHIILQCFVDFSSDPCLDFTEDAPLLQDILECCIVQKNSMIDKQNTTNVYLTCPELLLSHSWARSSLVSRSQYLKVV